MHISRRGLLKTMAAIGGSLAISPAKKAVAYEHFVGWPDSYGCLTDLTRCVGCRTCEEACNKANRLPKPDIPFDDLGVLDNKRRTTDKTYTVVNRYADPRKKNESVFRKMQCNHCLEPSCASACLVNAYTKTPEGPVIWNKDLCVGCRMCMMACPFAIPAFEYNNPTTPKIQKCNLCYGRITKGGKPACVEACPAEAIAFGKRRNLIKLAADRIRENRADYIDHIYGEREVGGTSWMYISGIPFHHVDLDTQLGVTPFPEHTRGFLSAVPLVLVMWPALLGGIYLFSQRREEIAKNGKNDHKKEEAQS